MSVEEFSEPIYVSQPTLSSGRFSSTQHSFSNKTRIRDIETRDTVHMDIVHMDTVPMDTVHMDTVLIDTVHMDVVDTDEAHKYIIHSQVKLMWACEWQAVAVLKGGPCVTDKWRGQRVVKDNISDNLLRQIIEN